MNKLKNRLFLELIRKIIIVVLICSTFFDRAYSLKEGDSVFLRSQEGKYLSTLNVFKGGISSIGFVSAPDAGSRWIIRRLDSAATGLEIPNGQKVRVFFQNAVTGGNIAWRVGWYNQYLDRETQAPLEDWNFHGISKLTGFVQGHPCDPVLYDITVNGDQMTISTINVLIPARRGKLTQSYYIGQLPGSDILRIGELVANARFIPTFTIERVQSPSFEKSSSDAIQKVLITRMFKKLPGKAISAHCFYTGKGRLHTFAIGNAAPGDSTQGYLYKLSPDDKSWLSIYTSIPIPGEGRVSPVVTDIYGNADGKIMISTAGNGYPAKHNDVERLNLTTPNASLASDDRFSFLAQNCIYAYYKRNFSFYGITHSGQSVSTMWDTSTFTQNVFCNGYLAIENSQLPMIKTVNTPDGRTLTVKLELGDGKRKITFIDGNGVSTTYPMNPNVGPYVRFKRDISTNVEGVPIYVEVDGGGAVRTMVNNWNASFVRSPGLWLEWEWAGVGAYAPFFEDLKQRVVRFGSGNKLFATNISCSKLLINEGQQWVSLPLPNLAGTPICIGVDDDGTFWFMDKTGKLFIRQGDGWLPVSGFDPNALGDPLCKFSVAGRADNIKLVVLSTTGKVGIYSGPIGSVKIKDLSVGNAQVWGMIDACVASDGTILLVFKDENFNEHGTIWRGSMALASNDENAAANLEALNAGDN